MEEHPWIASVLMALAVLICIALVVGYVILLKYLYSTNRYLCVALTAFPLLILYIRCVLFD